MIQSKWRQHSKESYQCCPQSRLCPIYISMAHFKIPLSGGVTLNYALPIKYSESTLQFIVKTRSHRKWSFIYIWKHNVCVFEWENIPWCAANTLCIVTAQELITVSNIGKQEKKMSKINFVKRYSWSCKFSAVLQSCQFSWKCTAPQSTAFDLKPKFTAT